MLRSSLVVLATTLVAGVAVGEGYTFQPTAGQRIVTTATGRSFAADPFGRLHASSDDGSSWVPSSVGLPVPAARRVGPIQLAAVAAEPALVYTVIRRFDHDADRGRAMLYRSVDGGLRWSALKELPNVVDGFDLAVAGVAEGIRVDLRRAGREPFTFIDRFARGAVAAAAELAPRDLQAHAPEQRLGVDAPSQARDTDAGNVAILHDDGTFLPRSDLAGKMLRFDPAVGGYEMRLVAPVGVVPLGERLDLADDTSVARPLPFGFPFFGATETEVWVSDNGNVSFRLDPQPDAIESSERLAAGPPRLAVFWDDFVPTGDGGVYYDGRAERVTITWFNVAQYGADPSEGEWNAFQLTLEPSGVMTFQYDVAGLDDDGLVGLSPGGDAVRLYADLDRDAPLAVPTAAVYEEFRPDVLRGDRVLRRFYQCHPDTYDQVVVWGASSFTAPIAGGEVARHTLVSNAVLGIGRPVLSDAEDYGSDGRLQSYINMGSLAAWPEDPFAAMAGPLSGLTRLARESARRFGAYVLYDDGTEAMSDALLAGDDGRWSFFLDSDGSLLGGNDYESQGGDVFVTARAATRFSPLDQYLMGLRPAFEVAPFDLMTDVTWPGQCLGGDCTPGHESEVDVVIHAAPTSVAVERIQDAEGVRMPAYGDAPSVFRQAWIVVVPAGELETIADLDKLDRYGLDWQTYFTDAVEGRGFVDITLGGTAVPPVGGVGNGLGAIRSGLDVILDWSASPVSPRRYVVHGTTDRGKLADSLYGIASQEALGRPDEIERFVDSGAAHPSIRSSLYFYEVFPRSCSDSTVTSQ